MSTLITINVTNNSPNLQNFFFFQQPAKYTGGPEVYSNSLFTAPLLPSASSGAVLSFSMNLQFYAGAQQQVSPPVVGQSSGQLSASQPIGLTPATGSGVNNTTTMSLAPSLGLTMPVATVGPQPGSFRIVTPTYNPISAYNVGSAVRTLTGGITLSNFVLAQPTMNIDCQPVLQFYVAVGTYTPGTVMNFTSASINAALCDATPGYATFNVTYNANGTWTVAPFALVKAADNTDMLIPGAAASNVDILNEAGTAVIARGYATFFGSPIFVQHINNPGPIEVDHDYQVGPTGGPYVGMSCIAKAGNMATFSR